MPRNTIILNLVARLVPIGLLSFCAPVQAESPDGIDYFEKRIRPLLAEHCYSCHSAGATELKGGLRLDTKEGLRAGGERGAVVKPGRPTESRLILVVQRTDPDLSTPPMAEHSLNPSQVADLIAWVEMGAPDPRVAGESASASEEPSTTAPHWAFQPLAKVEPPEKPAVVATAANPIDRFLLSRLAEKGLSYSPADRRTLIRRITFDLTGLPPTPDEVEAFVRDRSPGAFETVVDRLLASSAYGEKWGRQWLDLVRYADTSGCNSDYPIPTARLYRDWVIQAFNKDLPYEQFLREQLAGDLLAADSSTGSRDWGPTVATGYLAIARRFGSRASEFHLTIEDTIENVGKVMLGLSVNCARCHDHKYDPVSTRDYYALYGIFNSTRYSFPGTEIYQHPKDLIPLAEPDVAEDWRLNAEALAYLDDLVEKLLERKRQFERNTNVVAAVPAGAAAAPPLTVSPSATPVTNAIASRGLPEAGVAGNSSERFGTNTAIGRLPPGLQSLIRTTAPNAKAPAGRLVERKDLISIPEDWTMSDVKGALFDAQSEQRKLTRKVYETPFVRAYAIADAPASQIGNARIQKMGDPGALGDEVPRGFLEILGGQRLPAEANGSGRRELAEWIANSQNPLTARVMVNRMWQGHFAHGLVQTPNDFGRRGRPPSHPELLDWLAGEFIRSGWSMKHMHRLIVLSQAYQQDSVVRESRGTSAAQEKDPNNELLSRFPRRRLTAEELRDALLFVAGTLDREPGGAHPFPPERAWDYTQHRPFVADYPSDKRSVYLFQQRIRKNPYLELFDGADPNAPTAVRSSATSPLQALFALNSPLAHGAADQLAVRVGLAFGSDTERIEYAYRLAFGRPPVKDEVRAGREYLEQVREQLARDGQPADRVVRGALASYARVLLGSNEFMFVD